jgi:rhomboid protease GluP
MDWSLVLLSQGIEPTIECSEAGTDWSLTVTEEARATALDALEQYQLENRRWPWRREVLQPGLLFDWASLAWVMLVGVFFWLNANARDLKDPGIMDRTALAHGQWWRLFTATWLHDDLAHLAANASIGVVLLGLTMGRYGTGLGLLAAYLAGVGGNVAVWILSTGPHYGLGASGVVMGSLGLLAVQSFSLWRQTPQPGKQILAGISGGVLLFVLLGLTPGTDIVAHLGGFVCGLGIGAVLSPVPELARKGRANLAGGLMFTVLVVWPWWRALRATL